MKNYKILWSNIFMMYLTQAATTLALMNFYAWKYGNAAIVAGLVVGAGFGLSNVPLIEKKEPTKPSAE